MLTFDDLKQVYTSCKALRGGKNASYIPALAKVDPTIYAISICAVDGTTHNIGDYDVTVAIESVSKVFNLAYALKQLGPDTLKHSIGEEHSLLAFDSLKAANNSRTHTMNSFSNGGAMATLSLVYTPNQKTFKKNMEDNLHAFAGQRLTLNTQVYESEMSHLEHNLALAYTMEAYKRFYGDILKTVTLYTHLCSKNVTTVQLAAMAATLANGGVQPQTKERVMPSTCVPYVLKQMHINGLYQESPSWWEHVGLPGKSGVGGLIIIVVPGKMGIAILSPPLNRFGNSFKGVKTAYKLAPFLHGS